MVKLTLRTLLLFSSVVAVAGNATADDGREAFEKAARYFKAEEFEAALPHFQKAYELSGRRPAAVFALAQCERALKMYDEAIVHFEEYLESKPANAADVEETLALLRELQARRRADEAQEEQRRQQAARAQADADRQAQLAAEAADAKARAAREAEARRKAESELEALQRHAPPPAVDLVSATPAPPSQDDDTLLENPWFWVITGAVVVASAAVTTGVVLSQSSDPAPPYGGTTGVILRP